MAGTETLFISSAGEATNSLISLWVAIDKDTWKEMAHN